MEAKEYARQFWEQGFLHLKGFFKAATMDHINGICLDHFGMSPEWEHTDEFIEKSKCEIVTWFPIREGVKDFDEINDNKRFNEITEAILGAEWNNLYCMSMFSKEGTSGQAWHQDSPPEDASQFNLNRLVYTHDITEDIGGQVVFVPGSHKRGAITAGDPDEDMIDQMVLSPIKGDLVILHGHCWHRVLPVTGEYRISTNFRAMPKGTPEEITDIAVYRNMRYYFPTESILEEW